MLFCSVLVTITAVPLFYLVNADSTLSLGTWELSYQNASDNTVTAYLSDLFSSF